MSDVLLAFREFVGFLGSILEAYLAQDAPMVAWASVALAALPRLLPARAPAATSSLLLQEAIWRCAVGSAA